MRVQNEVKPDEFRVGDVVWDVVFGKGSVYKISEMAYCPIKVEFENGFERSFTQDGKIHEESIRTLFFSEPKIEASVTRPFVPTLVGKKVVVQYYDGTWIPHPVVVTEETEEEIFTISGSADKSDLIAVCEVSSENLLTPKK